MVHSTVNMIFLSPCGSQVYNNNAWFHLYENPTHALDDSILDKLLLVIKVLAH